VKYVAPEEAAMRISGAVAVAVAAGGVVDDGTASFLSTGAPVL